MCARTLREITKLGLHLRSNNSKLDSHNKETFAELCCPAGAHSMIPLSQDSPGALYQKSWPKLSQDKAFLKSLSWIPTTGNVMKINLLSSPIYSCFQTQTTKRTKNKVEEHKTQKKAEALRTGCWEARVWLKELRLFVWISFNLLGICQLNTDNSFCSSRWFI